MLEIDPTNQIFRTARFCRKIVPDGQKITDENYAQQLEKSGRGDIILRNPRTQIPKGFKLVEEFKDGEIIPGLEYYDFDGNKLVAVHVCNKQKCQGFRNGMGYRMVREDSLKYELENCR